MLYVMQLPSDCNAATPYCGIFKPITSAKRLTDWLVWTVYNKFLSQPGKVRPQ